MYYTTYYQLNNDHLCQLLDPIFNIPCKTTKASCENNIYFKVVS